MESTYAYVNDRFLNHAMVATEEVLNRTLIEVPVAQTEFLRDRPRRRKIAIYEPAAMSIQPCQGDDWGSDHPATFGGMVNVMVRAA